MDKIGNAIFDDDNVPSEINNKHEDEAICGDLSINCYRGSNQEV